MGLLLLAGVAPAGEHPETIQIFGHLTQAYGESSLGSILGTTEAGSTALRNVAIQFRWQKSDRDTFVIQLSHEERGEDLFTPESDEVELDWAFYERRLLTDSAVKVGRLNISLGIYNQVRDVGTVLPFFELPISFYAGVLNSAETVDGISFTHVFAARSKWALETEVYYGGWETSQQRVSAESKFGVATLEARAEDGMGAQLWLSTPVEGLRVGVGSLSWLLDGPVSRPGVKDRWKTFHASLDASGERWLFRAERRAWRFDQDFGAFLGLPVSMPAKARRDGFYAQIGHWLTPKIGLFGQYEEVSLEDNAGILPGLEDFHRDTAVSLNYRVSPDMLARVEYHTAETRFPLGVPGLPVAVDAPAVDVDWVIAALSVSF